MARCNLYPLYRGNLNAEEPNDWFIDEIQKLHWASGWLPRARQRSRIRESGRYNRTKASVSKPDSPIVLSSHLHPRDDVQPQSRSIISTTDATGKNRRPFLAEWAHTFRPGCSCTFSPSPRAGLFCSCSPPTSARRKCSNAIYHYQTIWSFRLNLQKLRVLVTSLDRFKSHNQLCVFFFVTNLEKFVCLVIWKSFLFFIEDKMHAVCMPLFIRERFLW